jgi:hypothetical protein
VIFPFSLGSARKSRSRVRSRWNGSARPSAEVRLLLLMAEYTNSLMIAMPALVPPTGAGLLATWCMASSTGVFFQNSTYFDWSPPAIHSASALRIVSMTKALKEACRFLKTIVATESQEHRP